MIFQYWPIPQWPQINVTVAQPLTPPGLPDWIKTLITAGVGFLFGITSNVAMEFVKPWIARKVLKRRILGYLAAELNENLAVVDVCLGWLPKDERPADRDREREGAVKNISNYRDLFTYETYNRYWNEERAIVSEIDDKKILAAFPHHIDSLKKSLGIGSYSEVEGALLNLAESGKQFLEACGIPRKPVDMFGLRLERSGPAGGEVE